MKKATDELKVFSSANPSKITKESSYPFVECATYADDIKYSGGGWQSNWHFVDNAFLDKGGNIHDYPDFG